MAVTASLVNVESTATVIVAPDPTRRRLIIHNPNAATLYVGGEAVDSTDGFPVLEGETLEIIQQHREDIAPQVGWYGAVESDSEDINVLVFDASVYVAPEPPPEEEEDEEGDPPPPEEES
jgi:hypothetical protein